MIPEDLLTLLLTLAETVGDVVCLLSQYDGFSIFSGIHSCFVFCSDLLAIYNCSEQITMSELLKFSASYAIIIELSKKSAVE